LQYSETEKLNKLYQSQATSYNHFLTRAIKKIVQKDYITYFRADYNGCSLTDKILHIVLRYNWKQVGA